MPNQHSVFISYRRADSALAAQFLQRELVARFGEGQIFFDKGIEPGANYVDTLRSAAGACDVLVVLIGPDWLQMKDDQGRRRLEAEEDWVRVEVATALGRGIRVIPLLLRGAQPPPRSALPEALAALADMQALMLRDDDLDSGIARLIAAIEKQLGLAKPSASQRERSVTELIKQARLLKNEADEMYLKRIRSADKPDWGADGRATVDLSSMLEGFDESAHGRKLEQAHALLKEANALDPTNTEVLLLSAELLVELTPDDPTDEQELLYRLQSLIGDPKDDIERMQLAKAAFLVAQSGDGVNVDGMRSARDMFQRLGRSEWVKQCDDILAGVAGGPAPAGAGPPLPRPAAAGFDPVGNWRIQDSAMFASQWYMQFAPNGMLQGRQNTPALGIQAPLQGRWAFDPRQQALTVQGYVNGMMPFGVSIFIQGRSPQGWHGAGSDGNAYLLQPA